MLIIIAFGIVLAASMSLGFASRAGALVRPVTVEPYVLQPAKGLYLLTFSGDIEGGFSGDVKVILAGTPAMDYRLVNLAPARFFARSQGYGFQDGTLIGLKPGDKLAVLILMQPQLVKDEGLERPIASCCLPPETRLSRTNGDTPHPLALSFVDTANGKTLLQIPVEIQHQQ